MSIGMFATTSVSASICAAHVTIVGCVEMERTIEHECQPDAAVCWHRAGSRGRVCAYRSLSHRRKEGLPGPFRQDFELTGKLEAESAWSSPQVEVLGTVKEIPPTDAASSEGAPEVLFEHWHPSKRLLLDEVARHLRDERRILDVVEAGGRSAHGLALIAPRHRQVALGLRDSNSFQMVSFNCTTRCAGRRGEPAIRFGGARTVHHGPSDRGVHRCKSSNPCEDGGPPPGPISAGEIPPGRPRRGGDGYPAYTLRTATGDTPDYYADCGSTPTGI